MNTLNIFLFDTNNFSQPHMGLQSVVNPIIVIVFYIKYSNPLEFSAPPKFEPQTIKGTMRLKFVEHWLYCCANSQLTRMLRILTFWGEHFKTDLGALVGHRVFVNHWPRIWSKATSWISWFFFSGNKPSDHQTFGHKCLKIYLSGHGWMNVSFKLSDIFVPFTPNFQICNCWKREGLS